MNCIRILFVGGGTLGSVTPLLAAAEALQRESEISNLKFEIRFWGTRRGPERAIVEASGIPFATVPAGKFRRYWDIRNIFDAAVIAWATCVTFVRLLQWRPSVTVGAGSFAQVPTMLAARTLRIPIVIHQQDVRVGLANRLVAHSATRITAVFPEHARAFGQRTVAVIGNPVRREILDARAMDQRAAKRRFGFSGDRPVLLIIGGGTGAQALNELAREALPEFLKQADVIHVTGRNKMQEARGGGQNYRAFELLTDDLPYAYAAADLVVARAGMGTITELLAVRKPVALVPMPETHQEENAARVATAGAGVIWNERDLTPTTFVACVRELLHDTRRLRALAAGGATLATDESADLLAEIILGAARS